MCLIHEEFFLLKTKSIDFEDNRLFKDPLT